MADSLMMTCPQHGTVLIPSHTQPGILMCSDPVCPVVVSIAVPPAAGMPLSPLTQLEQGAAAHNELVCSYEHAGFTRTEAMQILCCVITAAFMKGSAGG